MIQTDTYPLPLGLSFLPGTANPGESICVEPGDRLYAAQLYLPPAPAGAGVVYDVLLDGTANAGAGYGPHFCYQPVWMRTQDVHDPPAGADPSKLSGLNGNASVSGTIRVDLGYLYCPWKGNVTFQGGTASPAKIPYMIAYGWDQHGRQTHGWWTQFRELIWRAINLSPRQGHLKLPRFPVDGRSSQRMTLTFFGAAVSSSGTTFPIQRPAFANRVWTPTPQTLVLDNGYGTSSQTVATNGELGSVPLSYFTRITPATTTSNVVIFGIDL